MNTFRFNLAAVLAVSLAVVACGGGGGDSVAAQTATPSAVDTSTLESFLAYQRTLQPAATINPATLQSQLAPISDTTEPTPIN